MPADGTVTIIMIRMLKFEIYILPDSQLSECMTSYNYIVIIATPFRICTQNNYNVIIIAMQAIPGGNRLRDVVSIQFPTCQ